MSTLTTLLALLLILFIIKFTKMIKKADIVLTFALIVIGLIMTWYFTTGGSDPLELKVTVNGQVYGTYDLNSNRKITIKQKGHINKITIHNNNVSMSFSDCHGQDCVRSHSISQTCEQIVCLPNKVILEIEGGEAAYDSISK